MIKMVIVFASVFLVFLLAFSGIVYADRIDFPNPVGYVNDFAEILTIDDELDARLRALEESDGTQVLIITTDELPKSVTLESFVPRLTDNNPEWAAGQEEDDNGVILTIVVDDRSTRIDVGYGLEGALPDILTKHIQDDYVMPHFREGNYDDGVRAGVDKVLEAVEGEYTVEDVESEQDFGEQFGMFFGQSFFCGIIFLFFVLPYMAAFLGRTKKWWPGGVVGVVLGMATGLWFSLFTLFGMLRYFGFLIFPLVLGGLGLLFDYILSKNYKKRKKKGMATSWGRSWGGFSSGGSSSSSGGGFSSGGGSFGGGGSSSGW